MVTRTRRRFQDSRDLKDFRLLMRGNLGLPRSLTSDKMRARTSSLRLGLKTTTSSDTPSWHKSVRQACTGSFE